MLAAVVATILVITRAAVITLFIHEINIISISLNFIILLAIITQDDISVVAIKVLRSHKNTISVFALLLLMSWINGYNKGLTDLIM